jgi:hypothetical protein
LFCKHVLFTFKSLLKEEDEDKGNGDDGGDDERERMSIF